MIQWRSLDAEDLETTYLLVQRGLERGPTYAPFNNLASEVLLMLGFPLGAIAYFETSLRLGQEGRHDQTDPCPKSAITIDLACCLDRAYQQRGQPKQAIALFELALSFDANCAIEQQALGDVRSKR